MKKTKAKSEGLYVDGFVLVVSKANLPAYKKMATLGCKVWMKNGALDYKECVMDDATPDSGGMKIKRFPEMAKAKGDEVTVFSYIVFKNRKHRDEVNKKVMKDPMMNDPKYKDMAMPFDMKRMAYGGFKVVVTS